MKKQYQNIGAQIVNLEKNKNVLKSTIPLKCFYEKTYLDLITPYSDLIALGRDQKSNHIYSQFVDFEEYLEFNRIDSAICNHLHILIGAFEKMMKNFLMHTYCSKMKESGDLQTKDYSWTGCYIQGSKVFDLLNINEVFCGGRIVPAGESLVMQRKKVLKTLTGLSSSGSKSNIVAHYLNKYGYVPMFVAVHSLSLGQLLTLFGMLNQNDKNRMLCIFNGIDLSVGKRYSDSVIERFEKDILRIHVIRNIVNHYEPIFPLIQNTEFRTFGSLVDLLSRLNEYYKRTVSFAPCTFSISLKHRSRNNYSREFHLKIERILNAFK